MLLWTFTQHKYPLVLGNKQYKEGKKCKNYFAIKYTTSFPGSLFYGGREERPGNEVVKYTANIYLTFIGNDLMNEFLLDFESGLHKDKKLFTPGPLGVSFETKRAMLRDLGSRDTEFIGIVKTIRSRLLGIAGVSPEEYTAILVQGSGTYAIEAVLTTTTPRQGGKVFIIENGSYGKRMVKICEVAGIETVRKG